MSEIKGIDFEKDSFEANGKEYFIEDTLSVERFIEFEKLMHTFGFGKDFEQVYKELNVAWTYANKGQMANCAVVMNNIIEGITRNLENRLHPALELACLFCNTKDEDRAKYDILLNKEKVEDWKKEGIAMQSFFTLAANKVEGFIEIYSKISQSISNKLKTLPSLDATGKPQ